MTKKERLEAIIDYYSDGKPSVFAKYIGVAPSTISSWLSRDTLDYDLIFAKCENISSDWLLTGTSDAIDTDAIMKLILKANSKTKKLGLLYDKSQDSSKQAIADAKKFCKENGISVVEKTGTTNDEVALAADALVAAKVDAVFTPTDNTIMKAELAIYEKFVNAKIPHYTGADSFALNGAFAGYGVNYKELGVETADMVADILVNGAKPGEMAIKTLNNGIATVNTETAEQIGLDYSGFKDMCEKVVETKTAKEFDEK